MLPHLHFPTFPWSKQGATTTTDVERNPYQGQERVQDTSFPNSFSSKDTIKIVYYYFDHLVVEQCLPRPKLLASC